MLCAARASGRAPPSLRRAQRKARSSTVVPSLKGGPFCAPIGGPVCTPIDRSSKHSPLRNVDRVRSSVAALPTASALPPGAPTTSRLTMPSLSTMHCHCCRCAAISDSYPGHQFFAEPLADVGGLAGSGSLDATPRNQEVNDEMAACDCALACETRKNPLSAARLVPNNCSSRPDAMSSSTYKDPAKVSP